MSFNNVPQLAPGGSIYPMRFLKMGSSSLTAVQAGLGDYTIGISGQGTIDNREDAENLYHATTTAGQLEVRGFGDADEPLQVGASAWSVGDFIGSDADGKGIPVYAGNAGAIALEAATGGLTAEFRRVWILPQSIGIGNVTAYSTDTAIVPTKGIIVITKTSAIALTIANPALTDNGKEMLIVATTAYAHTVTLDDGFNSSGSTSNVATFNAAKKGASMRIVAYQGVWYATNLQDVTLG